MHHVRSRHLRLAMQILHLAQRPSALCQHQPHLLRRIAEASQPSEPLSRDLLSRKLELPKLRATTGDNAGADMCACRQRARWPRRDRLTATCALAGRCFMLCSRRRPPRPERPRTRSRAPRLGARRPPSRRLHTGARRRRQRSFSLPRQASRQPAQAKRRSRARRRVCSGALHRCQCDECVSAGYAQFEAGLSRTRRSAAQLQLCEPPWRV